MEDYYELGDDEVIREGDLFKMHRHGSAIRAQDTICMVVRDAKRTYGIYAYVRPVRIVASGEAICPGDIAVGNGLKFVADDWGLFNGSFIGSVMRELGFKIYRPGSVDPGNESDEIALWGALYRDDFGMTRVGTGRIANDVDNEAHDLLTEYARSSGL